jgi:hypothetical protein
LGVFRGAANLYEEEEKTAKPDGKKERKEVAQLAEVTGFKLSAAAASAKPLFAASNRAARPGCGPRGRGDKTSGL